MSNKPNPDNITISALNIYPVKGCAGIPVSSLELTRTGIAGDREWMIVDEGGTFLSQRKVARMCLVLPRLAPDALVLSAPGMPDLAVDPDERTVMRRVRVWLDSEEAFDAGDETAAWLSDTLGVSCRLVRAPVERDRSAWRGGAGAAFADAHTALVISEASLSDLNARLAVPLPMNRFRPNIVVAGCAPYAEDDWPAARFGEVEMLGATLCTRCLVTTTDQQTGERAHEPLKTLATYRRRGLAGQVVFGRNFSLRDAGVIRAGDAVAPRA
ncbi:MOSC domain-containing protein [bacterium]|nr:MOSC domain-containing protein [bacterium]